MANAVASRDLIGRFQGRRARFIVSEHTAGSIRRNSAAWIGERAATPREIAAELVAMRHLMFINCAHPTAIEAKLGQEGAIASAAGGLEKGIFGGDEVEDARRQYLSIAQKDGIPENHLVETTNYMRALIDAIAAKWEGAGWFVVDGEGESHLVGRPYLCNYFNVPVRGEPLDKALQIFKALTIAMLGASILFMIRSVYKVAHDNGDLWRSIIGLPDFDGFMLAAGTFSLGFFSAAIIVNEIVCVADRIFEHRDYRAWEIENRMVLEGVLDLARQVEAAALAEEKELSA